MLAGIFSGRWKIIRLKYKLYTLVQVNKAKLNRPSLALLRCESNYEISERGLIVVQIEILIFRAWAYCGANWNSKFASLALLWCKSKLEFLELSLIFAQIEIFELGLIVMQIEIRNFRVWPYCVANRTSKFSSLHNLYKA